jgi:hypothetical protein
MGPASSKPVYQRQSPSQCAPFEFSGAPDLILFTYRPSRPCSPFHSDLFARSPLLLVLRKVRHLAHAKCQATFLTNTHQRDTRDERESAMAYSCRPTPPRRRSLDSPILLLTGTKSTKNSRPTSLQEDHGIQAESFRPSSVLQPFTYQVVRLLAG